MPKIQFIKPKRPDLPSWGRAVLASELIIKNVSITKQITGWRINFFKTGSAPEELPIRQRVLSNGRPFDFRCVGTTRRLVSGGLPAAEISRYHVDTTRCFHNRNMSQTVHNVVPIYSVPTLSRLRCYHCYL